MTQARLTASALWRAEPCPASVVLPAERREYKDAKDGTRIHADHEAAPPPGAAAEVAFAYNVLSGEAREVGRSIGRNYGQLAREEIPGTTDRMYVMDDHVLVEDLKSGNGYAEQLAGVFDKPEDNAQLQHNSLCAALVYDKPLALTQVIYLKTGEVKDAKFDAFDFAAIRIRLRAIWERSTQAAALLDMGAEPPSLVGLGLVNEGPHCWRCTAEKACPLKSKRRKS